MSATIDPTGLDDAAERLGLNALETAVLGVVAAPELDARYARLRVTPRMLSALCGVEALAALAPSAPLIARGAVRCRRARRPGGRSPAAGRRLASPASCCARRCPRPRCAGVDCARRRSRPRGRGRAAGRARRGAREAAAGRLRAGRAGAAGPGARPRADPGGRAVRGRGAGGGARAARGRLRLPGRPRRAARGRAGAGRDATSPPIAPSCATPSARPRSASAPRPGAR